MWYRLLCCRTATGFEYSATAIWCSSFRAVKCCLRSWSKVMNRSSALIAAVATIALTPIASAADLPRKAPPYTPVAVWTWTGFYVGGNVGYSWGKANTDFNADPVTLNTNLGPINIPGFAGAQSVHPKGVIGGGQIGYNWQFSPNWVAGLEADFQGSG